MREEGLIGAVSAGMNQSAMLTEFARTGDFDCFLLAGRYSLLDQSGLADLLPECASRGISVIVGGVYNSGILADPVPGATYDYRPAAPAMLAKAQAHARPCAHATACRCGRPRCSSRSDTRGRRGTDRHALAGRGRRRGRDGVDRDPRPAVAGPGGRGPARRGGADAMTVIDAHHHLWTADYAWLRRRVAGARSGATTRSTTCASHLAPPASTGPCWSRRAAATTPRPPSSWRWPPSTPEIAGVVGWASLTVLRLARHARGAIAPASAASLLVGVRDQTQAQPADHLDRRDVRAGLATVRVVGLVNELVVRSAQLPSVARAAADAAGRPVRARPPRQARRSRPAAGRTGARVAAGRAPARNVRGEAVRSGRGGGLGHVDGRGPAAVSSRPRSSCSARSG